MLSQKISLRQQKQLQPLTSSAGKPTELTLHTATSSKDDSSTSASKRSCGSLVVDILPRDAPCNIGSISFKNYYTAFLTVKVKTEPEESDHELKSKVKWRTCLHQYQLMPAPHCETGSQDYFTISYKKMLFLPERVKLVRLILQQPSPLWTSFKVENVTLTSDRFKEDDSSASILQWLRDEADSAEAYSGLEKKSDATVKEVAGHMQQLWALTETVQLHQQTQSSLGRFDVDGFYEINLLSYS